MGRRRSSVVALAVFVLGGCVAGPAGGRPPGAPGPDAAKADEPVAPDSILWSADRRLTWKDFQALPPPASAAAAVTSYVISYEAECRDGRLTFDVVSAFLPERSWVKTSVLSGPESDGALRHEQTHFDLSEVAVRRARQAIGALRDPCAGDETTAVDAVARAHIREDVETQQQYDRETAYGSDPSTQVWWESRVKRDLQALAAWTRTVPG